MPIVFCLSHFHRTLGPRIFLHAPMTIIKDKYNEIPKLMDFRDTGFFIHISKEIKALNHIFEIPSEYARGHNELIQASLIISIKEEVNILLVRDLLKGFEREVSKIGEVYKAFYIDSTKYKGDVDIYKQLENTFHSFYSSFKPALKALKDTEMRYQALFRDAIDPIFIFDFEEEKIIEANAQAEKILLRDREQILNLGIKDIFSSDDYQDILDMIHEKIGMEEHAPVQMEFINSVGKRIPVELNGSVIQIGDSYYIQGIFRDITERKIAEKKIKDSEQKYRTAYNMANFYKDLFTHDMNNILNNINSSAELVSLSLYNPQFKGNRSDILNILKEQVVRGSNLISNVRKVSSIDENEVKLEEVDLCHILQQCFAQIKAGVKEKKIEFNIVKRGESYFVQAGALLSDVFENLIKNSIKFNEHDVVEITVKISREIIDKVSYVHIELIDNSYGIMDDVKEEIFGNEFIYNLKTRKIGIGLVLVKKIINAYNGKIEVRDRVQGDHTQGISISLFLRDANQIIQNLNTEN